MHLINTREDLDAIAGTPEHDDFINFLKGSIYHLEKDDVAQQWLLVTDVTTIEKYNFTLSDFAGLVPPDIPVYAVKTIAELNAESNAIILAQIAELEAQQARPLREIALGDTTYSVTKLQSLNNQIAALRAQLV